MPSIKDKHDLQAFLLSRQLVAPDDWNRVESELVNGEGVSQILQLLERRHLLTPLQTGRILKGDTDGLVLGPYKLLYRNASGSFARVFRASTLSGNQVVALKLLRERWASDPKTVAGFHREARICQRFQHPNIVPIYDIGSEGRFQYFTMEFVEGGNLRDFLKIRKIIEPVEATRCVLQICAGLEYALSQGATHRDLKLTNVLMSSTGVAKLVDFGLAGADSPGQAGTSDEVQRALEYSALERGTNASREDPRSDIFFAGAIYYELLSGESPWPRTRDREERRTLSRYTNTTPLRIVKPGLPKIVHTACERMMEVNPMARYQSAAETVRELRKVMEELGEHVDDHTQPASPLRIEVNADFRLLIVDSVRKRCQVMKKYFNRHGFEVSLALQPETALERLQKRNPPDGILILADENADEVMEVFPQFQAYARSRKVPCAVVFAQEDATEVEQKINSTRLGKTFFQPVTLKDIRGYFDEIGAVTRS
jgi:eukaryotic-like serine/threonine-protein kinase